MSKSKYKITTALFKKYIPAYAHKEFLIKAKICGIADFRKIISTVDQIVNDEPVDDPRFAGHIFEIMLLDAVLTDFLSPKHGIENTLLAKNPNQPIVDFVTFKNNKPFRLYQVKWSLDEIDALNAVQDAWGTLEPCSEVTGAEPCIIVNHAITEKLTGRQKESVRVVFGQHFFEWWQDRFLKEIVSALRKPEVREKVLYYSGKQTLALNPIQKEHFSVTDEALQEIQKASWHLCPGYGKTILGLNVLKNELQGLRKNELAIVAVPRLNLADQWRRRLREYKEFNDVGIEIFGTYEANADISVNETIDDLKLDPKSDEMWDRHGTTNINDLITSLSDHRKKLVISTYHSLPRLVKSRINQVRFPFLLADEVHRSGKLFKIQRGKSIWSKLCNKYKTKLIVSSATVPTNIIERIGLNESTCFLSLDQALNEEKYSKYLTRGKYARLCDIWGLVRLARKKDKEKDLYDFLVRKMPSLIRKINKWTKQHSVKTLVFCSGIESAIKARDLLRKYSRNKEIAFAVSSSRRTSDEPISAQRHLRMSINKFKRSKSRVQFLTNANILTEGIDLPDCHAVVVLSPRSYAVLTQIMGRAVRYTKGKRSGLVAFYGTAPDIPKAKVGAEKYRNYAKATIACAYNLYYAIQGTGTKNSLYTERRANRLVILDEKGMNTKSNILEKLAHSTKRFGKDFGYTRVYEPENLSMVQQLQKYKEIQGDLDIPKDAKGEWAKVSQWVNKVRSRYRRKKLSREWVQQLESLGLDWKVTGQTILDPSGYITEKQASKEISNIAKYRKKGWIKPAGKGITSGGMSYLYLPEQLEKLKKFLIKKYKLTIFNIEGFITEKESRKKIIGLRRYRKKGWITPAGRGMTSGGPAYLYKASDEEKIKKILKQKFGITIFNPKGLITETELIKHTGLTLIRPHRAKGLIKAEGYGFCKGGLGYLYKPNMVEIIMKKYRVTLTNIKGLLNEKEARKKAKISPKRFKKCLDKGMIKPKGYAYTKGATLSAFFTRHEVMHFIRKLKKEKATFG